MIVLMMSQSSLESRYSKLSSRTSGTGKASSIRSVMRCDRERPGSRGREGRSVVFVSSNKVSLTIGAFDVGSLVVCSYPTDGNIMIALSKSSTISVICAQALHNSHGECCLCLKPAYLAGITTEKLDSMVAERHTV